MVIRVPPKLPGFQLLRDTFAGKNLEKFGDGKLILKKCKIFTGKSVAQQVKSWEPGSLPFDVWVDSTPSPLFKIS